MPYIEIKCPKKVHEEMGRLMAVADAAAVLTKIVIDEMNVRTLPENLFKYIIHK